MNCADKNIELLSLILQCDETNAINVSIILKHEERAYQRPDGYGFTHLDNDGDKLVSGSGKGEVVAWDFRSNQKLYMVDSKQVC